MLRTKTVGVNTGETKCRAHSGFEKRKLAPNRDRDPECRVIVEDKAESSRGTDTKGGVHRELDKMPD